QLFRGETLRLQTKVLAYLHQYRGDLRPHTWIVCPTVSLQGSKPGVGLDDTGTAIQHQATIQSQQLFRQCVWVALFCIAPMPQQVLPQVNEELVCRSLFRMELMCRVLLPYLTNAAGNNQSGEERDDRGDNGNRGDLEVHAPEKPSDTFQREISAYAQYPE